MSVMKTTKYSIAGSLIRLDDLRDLVARSEKLDGKTSIGINVSPGDYNQGSHYTISVTGTEVA